LALSLTHQPEVAFRMGVTVVCVEQAGEIGSTFPGKSAGRAGSPLRAAKHEAAQGRG
jgi:hypothetical protein